MTLSVSESLSRVEAILSNKSGPSRKCTFDDVYFYLLQAAAENQGRTPDIPAQIVKMLVLSNMFALLEYLKAIISRLEEKIRASKDIKHYAWLGDTISELFAWNRRIADFCEYTEAALDELGISINYYYYYY